MSASPLKKTSFGTIRGVLVPNITMMFGVILFLRLGVITASAGIGHMLTAIGLSLLIMTLTSFSIGSLATNMRVGDGGIYFIISRTLGIEIGGALGIAIYFAQLISIALTVSGFSLSFCEFFPRFSLHWVELLTLGSLALLSGFSASWAIQLQSVILILLIASISSIFLGSPSYMTVPANPAPFFPQGSLGFWECFAMFYPALTGIEASMALSGSLRNPGKSLFYGNLYSLCFVATSYALLSLFIYFNVPFDNLLSDPFSLVDFSPLPALVRAGIWGATLSTALGCLLGTPRMLQSMSQDGIISSRLARTHGKQEEPRIALVTTVVIAGVLMLFTTIDQLIPMLTMICLVSYGLLNFVAAFSELMNIPSWRPTFRVPWYLSIGAVGLIVITMFMIAPGWTFITLITLFTLYAVLRACDVKSGFLDLRDSFIFFISRLALYRLEEKETEHGLTWHPQILALIPSPEQGSRLTYLAHSLTRRSGILTFVTVIPEEWGTLERIQSTRALLSRHFEQLNIACLSDVYPCSSVLEGYLQLVKAYGIGHIQPNTISLELQEKLLDEKILELIDTCRLMEKNILFLQDNPSIPESYLRSRIGANRKKIDIWWNPDETRVFDLIWSLVTTLTDGFAFQGARVTVKAWSPQKHAKSSIEKHLNRYVKESRLKADVHVYHNKKELSFAPLSFICLSSLPEEAEDEERRAYLEYLRNTTTEISGRTIGIFVTAYDNVDHRAIYLPHQ